MVKETPSIGRLLAMLAFAFSCVGILLFLWLSFGGSVPLQSQEYRVRVAFPEAATLVEEADVRLAGVNVGKVKKKKLLKGAARTEVELEIKNQYAPIPKDTRAILRQKTLLGETYVELAPGDRSSGMLEDGDKLANNQVEPTVELDEIFNAFDQPTRKAFQEWVAELSKAAKGNGGQDLNDALGNLEGFAVDGSTLLKTLNEQEVAVRRLIKNTGVVFGAVNERQGALRQLVVNSNNTFEATASRDQALAETIRVFPTFLDESKATLARLENFSRRTRPLVNLLKPSADDLGPTVRDLGDLAPDLEGLFRDLNPLIKASRTGLPDLTRVVKGAEPVFESGARVLPRAQPDPVAAELPPGHRGRLRLQRQRRPELPARRPAGAVADRDHRPEHVADQVHEAAQVGARQRLPGAQRAAPRAGPGHVRVLRLQARGRHAARPGRRGAACPIRTPERPPCFVAPPSLYSGKKFNFQRKGNAPNKSAPQGTAGNSPARP